MITTFIPYIHRYVGIYAYSDILKVLKYPLLKYSKISLAQF